MSLTLKLSSYWIRLVLRLKNNTMLNSNMNFQEFPWPFLQCNTFSFCWNYERFKIKYIIYTIKLLYQRMVAKKEISTVAKTKNTKARKNFDNCIGNKWVKSSSSWVCEKHVDMELKSKKKYPMLNSSRIVGHTRTRSIRCYRFGEEKGVRWFTG